MNTSNSSRKMLFIVLMIFFASSALASLQNKELGGKTSSSFSVNKIGPFVATFAPFRYSKYNDCGSETHKATIVSLKLDKDFKKCKITGEVMNRVQEEKIK